MNWVIEHTRQKIIEGWNDIVNLTPKIWDCILKIVNDIIDIIKPT